MVTRRRSAETTPVGLLCPPVCLTVSVEPNFPHYTPNYRWAFHLRDSSSLVPWTRLAWLLLPGPSVGRETRPTPPSDRRVGAPAPQTQSASVPSGPKTLRVGTRWATSTKEWSSAHPGRRRAAGRGGTLAGSHFGRVSRRSGLGAVALEEALGRGSWLLEPLNGSCERDRQAPLRPEQTGSVGSGTEPRVSPSPQIGPRRVQVPALTAPSRSPPRPASGSRAAPVVRVEEKDLDV